MIQQKNNWAKILLKESDTPEGFLISAEIEERLADVIEKLSDDLRIVYILRELEGFSYEDIADLVACPLGTVRSRIFRAREKIEMEINKLLYP